jgi:predicted enzyme related to lactoylglutathione lyase
MKTLAVSTLLVVHDLEISKKFYIDTLGLTFISEHENCVQLKIGDHEVVIFEGDSKGVNYRHGYESNSTLVLIINNLDEKIDLLKKQGVEFVHQTPNENQWGRYAAFKDPSGIVHEIFESKI